MGVASELSLLAQRAPGLEDRAVLGVPEVAQELVALLPGGVAGPVGIVEVAPLTHHA